MASLLVHQVNKERCTNKGSQNTDGDFHRQQVPADVIYQQQKCRSKQHRSRQQLAVIVADISTA